MPLVLTKIEWKESLMKEIHIFQISRVVQLLVAILNRGNLKFI